MHRFLMTAALLMPMAAHAAGSDDNSPPQPTQTTTECKDGTVWSTTKKTCVDPQSGALQDDELYRAARELAYAGRYDATLRVLAAMSDPLDDRVLTYKGFVHRKLGDAELGFAYYRQAIARNPDNLLARSYMGQGLVELGKRAEAEEQLREIRYRGGLDSWADVALRKAIEGGAGYNY